MAQTNLYPNLIGQILKFYHSVRQYCEATKRSYAGMMRRLNGDVQFTVEEALDMMVELEIEPEYLAYFFTRNVTRKDTEQ